MQKLLSLTAALGLALLLARAHAADAPAAGSAGPGKSPMAQQSKMKTCNTQAVGKKGDERKAFMKECLRTKRASPHAGQS
ncbi:MAG: hypothetical protein K2Q97_18845 [Burkholderiaceae bacterium]|nr:hypothetical protein [Burkholderiaceae bacterium]